MTMRVSAVAAPSRERESATRTAVGITFQITGSSFSLLNTPSWDPRSNTLKITEIRYVQADGHHLLERSGLHLHAHDYGRDCDAYSFGEREADRGPLLRESCVPSAYTVVVGET